MVPRFLRWMVLVAVMCSCLAKKVPKPKSSTIYGMKPRGTTSGTTWTYQGATDGTDQWASLFPNCALPDQSPIDLPAADDLAVEGQDPLVFTNYNRYPIYEYLLHDGWTTKFVGIYDDEEIPNMTGGGLNDTYELVQMHFHWGDTNNVGSEHTIDGVAAPLEIHLVHSNGQDLAVLGILTHIDEQKKSVLEPFRSCLKIMEEEKDRCLTLGIIKLSKLFPKHNSRFYRYIGSTTTPDCLEDVTWTVMEDTVPISSYDLDLLRLLEGRDGLPLTINFRPTQPIGDRDIYLYDP